jgi:hypothetical protein
MRNITRSVLFAIGLLVYTAPSAAEAQCRAADSTSQRLVAKYQGLMRSTDPDVRLALSRNGIQQVDPSTVTLITDKTVCSKAERAYSATNKGSTIPSSGSVYLVKVGAVYVLRDPVRRSGGWAADVVLDSQFKVMAKLLA